MENEKKGFKNGRGNNKTNKSKDKQLPSKHTCITEESHSRGLFLDFLPPVWCSRWDALLLSVVYPYYIASTFAWFYFIFAFLVILSIWYSVQWACQNLRTKNVLLMRNSSQFSALSRIKAHLLAFLKFPARICPICPRALIQMNIITDEFARRKIGSNAITLLVKPLRPSGSKSEGCHLILLLIFTKLRNISLPFSPPTKDYGSPFCNDDKSKVYCGRTSRG